MIVEVTMVIFSFGLGYMEFSTVQPQSQDINNIHKQIVCFSAVVAHFLEITLLLTLSYLPNNLRQY